MKVLLTGITGFIGSHLARQLIAADCEIFGLVRQQSNFWRIKDILPSIKLVTGDISDSEDLENQLAKLKPDACLHLAWFAEPGTYLNAMQNLDVLTASIRLVTLTARSGCKYFLGVGSCFEYDASYGYLSESTPVKPQSLYAGSKLALKLVLDQVAQATDMGTAWARLFFQYGSYEDKRRVIPAVICSLLNNQKQKLTPGEQIRDYLHVEDVAYAIAEIFRHKINGQVNIGSGRPITIREMAMKIGTLLNRTELLEFGAVPYRPGDPMFICADNRRLIENTDWKPRMDMEEGLLKTIDWWQKQMQIV